MTMHGTLAGRWPHLTLAERLANVGSEVDRAIRAWRDRRADRFDPALDRALELFDLTAQDDRWRGYRRREILRVREEFCGLFFGDPPPGSAEGLSAYFFRFGVLARALPRRPRRSLTPHPEPAKVGGNVTPSRPCDARWTGMGEGPSSTTVNCRAERRSSMPVRSLSSSVFRWPDKPTVQAAVRQWAQAEAVKRPDLVALGLFGSYARGDAGVGSDLDLVAIVRQHAHAPARRAAEWDLTGLPVAAELLVYTEAEWRALRAAGTRFARTLARELTWLVGSGG